MAAYDDVVMISHAKWLEVPNRDEIDDAWWQSFLGEVPQNVDQLSDAHVLALQILALNQELQEARQDG